MANSTQILNAIDWDMWVWGIGIPKIIDNFDTPVYYSAIELANEFIELGGYAIPSNW